jgi:hypothetical protein
VVPRAGGGFAVCCEATDDEAKDGAPWAMEAARVDRATQAMRWMRRRVRALQPVMDRAEGDRAAAWLADTRGLRRAERDLRRGRAVETRWSVGSGRVRLNAVLNGAAAARPGVRPA